MRLTKFLKDQLAATSIEYALIASVISISIVSVVGTIGTQLNAKFTSVAGILK